MHPYDNQERRYHHTDPHQGEGLAVVATLLGLAEPPSAEGVLYDLSIYSGGIGVLDRLAITLPADPDLWAQVIEAASAKSPEEASQDEVWSRDFRWLLDAEDESLPPREAAVRFINSERRPFQPGCLATARILFGNDSNVNDWVALWGDDTRLSYLGYSQG
jgi:hypothetical protein